MSHFNWRAPAALLAALALVVPAAAQAPATGAAQNQSQATQGSNQATQAAKQGSQGSNQAQTNANTQSQNNTTGREQGANAQGANQQGANQQRTNPQGISPGQDRNSQQQVRQSNRNSERQSSADNPSANPNLQGQSQNRLRSEQNAARVNEQNATRLNQNEARINNDARLERQGSRAERRTAMRPNDMRAPDVGLWFNHGSRDGLVISDIATTGPIARLGFREGDRIVSVNGHRIMREPEFMEYLLAGGVDRVPVIVLRNGVEETIYVEPSLLTEDYGYTYAEPLEQFGVVLDDRYDDRVVVWKVLPRTPAYYAGLRSGDVITTFGDHPYRTRSEFEKAIVGVQPGEANIQVRRGDRTRDLAVDVPQFERSNQSGERNEGVSNERNNDRDNIRENRETTDRTQLRDLNPGDRADRAGRDDINKLNDQKPENTAPKAGATNAAGKRFENR